MRTCGRDNVVVLIDLLHSHSSREPISLVSEIPPDRVRYMHVCDAPADVPTSFDDLRRIAREGRLLPGEGGTDVAGILQGPAR